MPCDEMRRSAGLSRREALQIGVGLFGLNLPALLRSAHAESAGPKKDISCIFIFLAGGPSHFETFDPKPDAPSEVRGLWKPISTNVPGTFICEKMPLMARSKPARDSSRSTRRCKADCSATEPPTARGTTITCCSSR